MRSSARASTVCMGAVHMNVLNNICVPRIKVLPLRSTLQLSRVSMGYSSPVSTSNAAIESPRMDCDYCRAEHGRRGCRCKALSKASSANLEDFTTKQGISPPAIRDALRKAVWCFLSLDPGEENAPLEEASSQAPQHLPSRESDGHHFQPCRHT